MAESLEEKEALAKLDAVTQDVAADELIKEGDREFTQFRPGPLWLLGAYRAIRRGIGRPLPPAEADPIDERGLRDVLGEDAKP